MNVEEERSRSLWMQQPAPHAPRLTADLETDVLVVGAGIAGLVTAYELARAGRRVTVVDRGRLGRGMTARTTAHLAFASDDFFHELIRIHGRDAARAWRESQAAAVDLFERIAAEESIDCDFARLDGVVTAAEERDVDYLRKELDAAHAAGFTDAAWLKAGAIAGMQRDGVRFPRQGRFHPLKFLDGLAGALRRRGAALYQDCEVIALTETAGVVVAETADGRVIRARQAVVATNTPFQAGGVIHARQAPYRTYAIAAPVPRGSAADVLLWDTHEPAYHYVRLQPGPHADVLIVGGEDHKSGAADDGALRIRKLETWARARWPAMGRLTHAWSGQVYEPADDVGFIGRSPQFGEVYLVTGDSGQGLTTAGAAALILADLMQGRANPWASLYAPGRPMRRGLGEYLKENLDAARHWLGSGSPGEAASAQALGPGDGAIVKINGKPVAAYRDEDGELHLRSAACTHAGCTVRWNDFEGCWDCPCHGSQFAPNGQVLAGPAVRPLDEAPTAQPKPRDATAPQPSDDEARPPS